MSIWLIYFKIDVWENLYSFPYKIQTHLNHIRCALHCKPSWIVAIPSLIKASFSWRETCLFNFILSLSWCYTWICTDPPKSFFSKKTVISSKSRMKAIHLNFRFLLTIITSAAKDKQTCAFFVSRIRRFVIGLTGLNWVPAEVSLCRAAAFREKVFRHRQRAEIF